MTKKQDKKDWKKFKEDHNQENDECEESSANETPHPKSLNYEDIEILEEKLTLAEQEAFKNKETALRLSAELENVRARANREVTKAHLFGLEQIIKSLLPVLDSLEQALQLAAKDKDVSMTEGLELTMKLFMDVLKKHDVLEINPLGSAFNPHEHEAMSMQEHADTPANTVLVVFQKGFKLNDRVIRPARVIVSKGQATS